MKEQDTAILERSGRLYIPRDEHCPINFTLATFECSDDPRVVLERARRAYPEYNIILERAN